MILPDGDILVVDPNLVQSTHGDHGLFHALFHAGDDRSHGDQAGHTQNDSQHGQKGPEFMSPDILQSDQYGVVEVHEAQ